MVDFDRLRDIPSRGLRYYGRDGSPLNLAAWCALLEDDDYRHVAKTEVGPYLVSTIWLGLDHNFFGTGPPIIFETLVFGPEFSGEIDGRRYPTEADALAGHEEFVTLIRSTKLDAEDVLDDARGHQPNEKE